MPPALVADALAERVALDERSWVDVVRGFVTDADELHDEVAAAARWSQGRLFRYDHWVEEPRLGAYWKRGDPVPHPLLLEVHRSLQTRYRVRFDAFALARYRDGRDGQAFHRDRDMRWLDDTVIAVLTLGATRPWLLRPRVNRHDHNTPDRGATHDLAPASGDLLVMGGANQRDWLHSVPRAATDEERISLTWRWTSRRGRPDTNPGYADGRQFSDRPRQAGSRPRRP